MKYFEKIDGLRFVAILFVLVEHFAPKKIDSVVSVGYYGVDLFFIISGFLITSILFQSREDSFGRAYLNFMGRRTLRIFPLYYGTILLLWLLNLEIVREKLIWLLTYTYNYAWILLEIQDTPVNHFWSLCVEEQFYLFWPFVVLSLRRHPGVLVAIILLIITLGFVQILFHVIPEMSPYNGVSLLTRMSSLGMGALGAIWSLNYRLPEPFFRSRTVEISVWVLLVVSFIFSYEINHFVVALVSLYLVLKAARFGFTLEFINRFLAHPWVIYIGTISYGIYIFHLPIGYYFSTYLYEPFYLYRDIWPFLDSHGLGALRLFRHDYAWVIQFPLYSLLTIGLASLSFRYFEKPILKQKDRYFGNRAKRPGVENQALAETKEV